MRRRTLLATLGATAVAGAAGCSGGLDDAVDEGSVLEFDAGQVTVGPLGVQSSFVADATTPATVHGAAGRSYVVFDCDVREYDAPIEDLPFAVVRGDQHVSDAADALVAGAGDGQPRIAFPVPSGNALETTASADGGDAAGDWAVVATNAYDRERRYPLEDALVRRLGAPAAWRVGVEPPDAMPATGTARAWATASNAGDAPGRLAALLTHDAADELYWTHAFDVDAGGESTFGFRFGCLCGDRDELAVTLDWGRDEWTGTVPVEA